MGPIEQLATYLSYPFVVNALVVGVLVALCSSLLGTTLVMSRLEARLQAAARHTTGWIST